MPTYQRLIKKKRLTEVKNFINNKGYFPNSLIISIDSKGKGLQFDVSDMRVDGAHSKIGILHLPKRYRSAYIIDGQHRLYGYSDSPYATTNSIPVVAFVDLDRQEQIKLFMDINENQKAVPKTLRVTLNADMLWDSPDYNQQRQALRSKLSQMLGEEETSPLMGRVVTGEDEKTAERCITVEAIQKALNRCDFLTQFKKKTEIVKDGTFDVGSNQKTCDLLYPFLEACLRYVKDGAIEEWEKGDSNDGILTMNRGIQAVVRVINDIVNHLVENKRISPKEQNVDEIVKEVSFYLDPLIEYINGVTQDARKELRGYFGGGADTRFWRTFQQEISKVRNDFAPDGLKQYWDNEAKTYNADSIKYIREIEVQTKGLIQNALAGKYGENWEIAGIPKPIYKRAKSVADEKYYDGIKSGDTSSIATLWDCVSLSECREIIMAGNHWTELFADELTLPNQERLSGGKKAKTAWIENVETIQNKLSRATYSVTKEEFEFIKSVYEWLIRKS
jgi:DNA sulfur modification protein DndB